MKMRQPVKKRPVVVRFLDHAHYDCDPSNIMKPLECEVVGYLVYEDKTYYRIVSWVTEDNLEDPNCEGYAVLKSTVTSVRRLKV